MVFCNYLEIDSPIYYELTEYIFETFFIWFCVNMQEEVIKVGHVVGTQNMSWFDTYMVATNSNLKKDALMHI